MHFSSTIINNKVYNIQYVDKKSKKKQPKKSKMVFSSGILSKNKDFGQSDNSSSDSESDDSKMQNRELIDSKVIDQVGKLAGKLEEKLKNKGIPLNVGGQTNITINHININQVISQSSEKKNVKSKGKSENLKKRGDNFDSPPSFNRRAARGGKMRERTRNNQAPFIININSTT